MRIIGIDPGSEISGVAVIDGTGVISYAANLSNEAVLSQILTLSEKPDVSIAIERIDPYVGRLSPQLIATAMWIGELSYRIRTEIFIESIFVPRNSVKKWIFDTCPEVCLPRIEKKMAALHKRKLSKGERGLMKKDGEMRLPSFHFVGDREVIASIKVILNISTPRPGQKNEFGLHSHSWSALGVCLYAKHNLIHAAPPNAADNNLHKVVQK